MSHIKAGDEEFALVGTRGSASPVHHQDELGGDHNGGSAIADEWPCGDVSLVEATDFLARPTHAR